MDRPIRYYANEDAWEDLMDVIRPAKLEEPTEDEKE